MKKGGFQLVISVFGIVLVLFSLFTLSVFGAERSGKWHDSDEIYVGNTPLDDKIVSIEHEISEIRAGQGSTPVSTPVPTSTSSSPSSVSLFGEGVISVRLTCSSASYMHQVACVEKGNMADIKAPNLLNSNLNNIVSYSVGSSTLSDTRFGPQEYVPIEVNCPKGYLAFNGGIECAQSARLGACHFEDSDSSCTMNNIIINRPLSPKGDTPYWSMIPRSEAGRVWRFGCSHGYLGAGDETVITLTCIPDGSESSLTGSAGTSASGTSGGGFDLNSLFGLVSNFGGLISSFI